MIIIMHIAVQKLAPKKITGDHNWNGFRETIIFPGMMQVVDLITQIHVAEELNVCYNASSWFNNSDTRSWGTECLLQCE